MSCPKDKNRVIPRNPMGEEVAGVCLGGLFSRNTPILKDSCVKELTIYSDTLQDHLKLPQVSSLPPLLPSCLPLFSPVGAQWLAHVWLFAAPWTVAREAPLTVEFSRQEYWSGLSSPPPEDPPDPGIQPVSPALAGRFFTTSANWEAPFNS